MRAGTGACPARARLLYPSVVTNKDSIRVILLLFGVHNHIYPVCKPPVSAIESAVAEKPNASVRDLQVCDASLQSSMGGEGRGGGGVRAHCCLCLFWSTDADALTFLLISASRTIALSRLFGSFSFFLEGHRRPL